MTTRTVTLVLCTGTTVHGCLGPVRVERPWWQEVDEVVAAARAVHGVEVVVLRLLRVATDRPGDGGEVCYLAEVARRPDVPLVAWDGADPLVDDPRRAGWARPGGPSAHLRWAGQALSSAGRALTGEPVQVRTWNLSSLWRLPTTGGPVWLKVVSDLLAPEGALLSSIGSTRPGLAPAVIAHDGRLVLLEEVPGTDQYDAGAARLARPVGALVSLQVELARAPDRLLALGVPDRRAAVAVERASDVVERVLPRVAATPDRVDRLRGLVSSLPDRLAAVEACGLPDTLVHGDFHPGNVRGGADDLRVLDWADAVVGRPEVDGLRLIGAVAPGVEVAMRQRWCAAWLDAVPDARPDRALDLMGPVAAVLEAAVYQAFLDGIEPDERPYHQLDPRECLVRADRLLVAERTDRSWRAT